jgi:penicillin G amidase
VPTVLIGHNADLAWGITSAIADTQDVFLERPTPDGQAVERADSAPEPIVSRIERIPVKGGDTVELRIRSTANGIILNDLLRERTPSTDGNPLALPSVASPYLLALRQNHDLPDKSFPALLALAGAAYNPV